MDHPAVFVPVSSGAPVRHTARATLQVLATVVLLVTLATVSHVPSVLLTRGRLLVLQRVSVPIATLAMKKLLWVVRVSMIAQPALLVSILSQQGHLVLVVPRVIIHRL